MKWVQKFAAVMGFRDDEPAASGSRPDLVRLTVALERAMRWDKLYLTHLTLDDLADHLGESRHRVSQGLNEGLGESFYDYVNRFRIEEAQRILASEQRRNLTEIADRVGFQTVHTFNRAFKKVTGTTPSSFRRSCTRQATPALR